MRLRYLLIAPLVALALLGVAPSPASARTGLPPDTATAGAVAVAVRGAAATVVITIRVVSGHTSWGLGVTHCGRGNAYTTGGVVVRSPNGARRDPAHIWPGDTATVTCARSAASTPVAAPRAPTAGRWVAPLAGALSVSGSGKVGGWGSCWLADRGDHLHQGVDFIRGSWTPIRAVHAGKVTRRGWGVNSGYIVAVTLGGQQTKYMHMVQAPSVRLNQYVAAGQLLGYVGATGDASGPHLHFEVWINGNDVNPIPWLRARGIPVRGC